MSKFDSDGFQIVVSKRCSKNKATKVPREEAKLKKEDIFIDKQKALQRIDAAVEELRFSDYLKDVIKFVSTPLQGSKLFEIICLGLGHIGECNISRHQLALLICLKDQFKPDKVLAHDPIFYTNECEILQQLDINVISRNDEGNYVIKDEGITLMYLPHCPKQLTNNFLWSNWGPKLQNCILICNSFNSLIENHPSRVLLETVPYIYKIFPYIIELKLSNNFKFTDIFNDLSIHSFPQVKLESINQEFWLEADKPQYENTEEFITSQMIQKLNI